MELNLKFSFSIGSADYTHAMIVNTQDPAHGCLNINSEDLNSTREMVWEANHYIRNNLISPHIEFSPVVMEENGIQVEWDLELGGRHFSGEAYFTYDVFTHDALPIGTDWEDFLRSHLSASQETLVVDTHSVRLVEPLMPPLEAVYVVSLGHKTKVYTNLSIAKAQVTRYASGNHRVPGFPCCVYMFHVTVQLTNSKQLVDRTHLREAVPVPLLLAIDTLYGENDR